MDKDFDGLSKKERKEKRREENQLEQKKEKNFLLISKAVVFLVVVVAGLFLLSRLFLVPESSKKVEFEANPKSYDFGKISASKGIVEKQFIVKNTGSETVKVAGMVSSCGCTSAVMQKEGRKSPVFGMHDNPVGWAEEFKPGEEAVATVYFDPNFHKGIIGPVTRTITLIDKGGRELVVLTVNADVTP